LSRSSCFGTLDASPARIAHRLSATIEREAKLARHGVLRARRAAARSIAGLSIAFALLAPVQAVVGGVEERDPGGLRRSVVALHRGDRLVCSGVLIAPSLVLSAAHCIDPLRPDRIVALDEGFRWRAWSVIASAVHPSFVPGLPPIDQKGVDLGILRVSGAFDGAFSPLGLDGRIDVSETLAIAGFGAAEDGAPSGGRRLRSARGLKSVPAFGGVRLFVDAATDGERPGRSACRGDSGGPMIGSNPGGRSAVAGIVSWTSGPLEGAVSACGGLTAVVPVGNHLDWIASAMQRLQATPGNQPRERGMRRPP